MEKMVIDMKEILKMINKKNEFCIIKIENLDYITGNQINIKLY